MGAIYTQIGAKQDRSTAKGLDAAVDNFLRAAGTFRWGVIEEHLLAYFCGKNKTFFRSNLNVTQGKLEM